MRSRPSLVQHRPQPRLRHVRILGEIVRAMRDLRSGWRDELVEDCRRDVLLVRRKRRQSAFEMRANDRVGAAEPSQGLRVAGRGFRSSRSCAHSRSRTSWRYGASIPSGGDGTVALSSRKPHPAGSRLVEHGLDQLGLDRYGLLAADELVPALERTDHRRPTAFPVECGSRR